MGDTALKLIGYVYFEGDTVETPYKTHFNVSGDGRKEAHLYVLNARQPEDVGEYFCAASRHSDGESCTLIQKPQADTAELHETTINSTIHSYIIMVL